MSGWHAFVGEHVRVERDNEHNVILLTLLGRGDSEEVTVLDIELGEASELVAGIVAVLR